MCAAVFAHRERAAVRRQADAIGTGDAAGGGVGGFRFQIHEDDFPLAGIGEINPALRGDDEIIGRDIFRQNFDGERFGVHGDDVLLGTSAENDPTIRSALGTAAKLIAEF